MDGRKEKVSDPNISMKGSLYLTGLNRLLLCSMYQFKLKVYTSCSEKIAIIVIQGTS